MCVTASGGRCSPGSSAVISHSVVNTLSIVMIALIA